MVRLLFILILVSTGSRAETYRLETVPSSNDISQGEQLTLNYTVVADADTVEIEVAKFPEFRGFWSENLLLRQGNISLLSEQFLQPPGTTLFQELTLADLKRRFSHKPAKGPKRGVIGTYILTPMVGKEDLKIEPMKIVVRNPLEPSQGQQTIESTELNIKIRRLPTLSQELASSFNGAVGRFQVGWERNEVAFRPEEPLLLRLNLSGQGNFFEINNVPLSLPKGFEVLSQKSTLHGSGQYAQKIFDTVLMIHDSNPEPLKPGKFVYFDPGKNKYVALDIPEIRFFLSPQIQHEEDDGIGELQKRTVLRTPSDFVFPIWVWLLQITAFAGLVLDLVRFKRTQETPNHSKSHSKELLKKLHVAETQLKGGNSEIALENLYLLAEELLQVGKTPLQGEPRSKKLRDIETRFGSELRGQLENFLTAFDYSRYHPSHTHMQPTEIYLKSLRDCIRLVA